MGRASGQAVSEVKALSGGASMGPVPAATAAAAVTSQTSGWRASRPAISARSDGAGPGPGWLSAIQEGSSARDMGIPRVRR